MNLKFVDEPGELYDVLSILAAYYQSANSENCHHISLPVDDEAQECIDEMKRYWGDIDDHLALFFEEREDRKVFALHELFPMLLETADVFNVRRELDRFLRSEPIQHRLFWFYFRRSMPESLGEIAAMVERTRATLQFKYQLLNFCMNPIPMLRSMVQEIERVWRSIRMYHKDYGMRQDFCRRQIRQQDPRKWIQYLSNIPGHMVRWSTKDELTVSVSCINRYALERYTLHHMMILGDLYERKLEVLYQKKGAFDLTSILHALGDPMRKRIFENVRESRTAVTLSKLSELLGESTSTVKYQLSILVDSGLIQSELVQTGRGKKELNFSVNHSCCSFAARNVCRLFGKGPEVSIEEKRRGLEGQNWWKEKVKVHE